MSRIGKQPVEIPPGVTLNIGADEIGVQGPKGSLSFPLFPQIKVEIENGRAIVALAPGSGGKSANALFGLTRAYLANMIRGVVSGFQKKLDIIGVGWNCKVENNALVLQVGFAHPVNLAIPAGIEVECHTNTSILVRGIDKQAVGQFAATIRKVRPPEPYKGKGIKYTDEVIRRKAGKAFGA